MIQFDLPKEKSSIIKVIGVGGGGGNAVNHMFTQNIEGVNFIICNTDAQALAGSNVPNKVQLGPHLTQGLGAGANPEIGRQATEESLEEIKRMLEVNTKMVFITAGMGGGTGTGGAPIIAKICRDLGILTVGIVSTPFSYEGRKRQLQAQEGINSLKTYVDTLLVISNDKLRHQFGNLKMREAFEKADNILSTAAKCITDVISSTGQVNVDFADVCTVMRNGGVAILGNAAVSGEDRAIRAIEEALNSPLLNDNEIRGAKWVLINISSAEGDYEYTVDEVEVIQNYLISQAGEGTDVVLGFGYDNTLDDKLGITLIATGFNHAEEFVIPTPKKEEKPVEKIIMTLQSSDKINVGVTETEAKATTAVVKEEAINPLMPVLTEGGIAFEAPMPSANDLLESTHRVRSDEAAEYFSLITESETVQQEATKPGIAGATNELQANATLKLEQANLFSTSKQDAAVNKLTISGPAYLSKPENIYAENKLQELQAESKKDVVAVNNDEDNEADKEIVLHYVEKKPEQPVTAAVNADEAPMSPLDYEEEKRKKAKERIDKLRNLTFGVNKNDPNSEYEDVPAYIRKNMELYNSSTIENYYSKYEVKDNKNQQGEINTINTFLDGKKPD